MPGAALLAAFIAQEAVGDPWRVKYKLITPDQIAEEVKRGAGTDAARRTRGFVEKSWESTHQNNRQFPSLMHSAYGAESSATAWPARASGALSSSWRTGGVAFALL